MKICSYGAVELTCVCPDTTLQHEEERIHLSTPLWFSQNQKPPCLSDSEDTVPLTGPNDIDRSVKTGEEHTGGQRGQNRHQNRYHFLKTLRTSGDLKPSGTVIECEGRWIPQCAPDKQIVENGHLFTPPIIFACCPREVKKPLTALHKHMLRSNSCQKSVCDSWSFSHFSNAHTHKKKKKTKVIKLVPPDKSVIYEAETVPF